MTEEVQSPFELIVIGGGISGLGVTLAAAQQGLSVALLEKEEIGRATSANSLRIIHGGFRYLQSFDLPRVIESLREQDYWLRTAPQFVKALPCLLPVEPFGARSRYPLIVAGKLYGLLSRWHARKDGGVSLVSKDFVEAQVPALKNQAPRGALLWRDALLEDPLKFAGYIRDQALQAGARIYERSPVTKIIHERPRRFKVEVSTRQGLIAYESAVVVNSAGPWLNLLPVQGATGLPTFPVRWCKGYNVILKKRLTRDFAFGVAGEGRFYFFVPRGEFTVLGTWYIPYEDDPAHVTVTEEEIAAFLSSSNRAFPAGGLSLEDVLSVEVGVLPMRCVSRFGPKLFGAHRISSRRGYLEVLSTKYTTFRSQGVEVARLAKRCLAASPHTGEKWSLGCLRSQH